MIKLTNVSKNYSDNMGVLENINLEIEKGDIFGIIGKSGAGKSTMLKIIGLLEEPSSGVIELNGKDISKLKYSEANKVKREIGTVFQSFNLLMQRNVEKNIAFPLELIKENKNKIKQRCLELAGLVGISEKLLMYPSQLSGGQKQRVAIARALATKPKILLCDEPTSALDSFTTKEILTLLKNINEKTDVTVVIITHEISVVRSICNRTLVLENGKILEIGKTEEMELWE